MSKLTLKNNTASSCFTLFIFGGPCHLYSLRQFSCGSYFPLRAACSSVTEENICIITVFVILLHWYCKYYNSKLEFLLQNYIEQLECGVQKGSLATGTRASSTQPPKLPAVPQSNDSQHSKPASDTALMRNSVFYSKFTTWPSSPSTTAASDDTLPG